MSASITAPRGLQTLNPSPEISRYYNKANTPYINTTQVLSEVLLAVRYVGQTFLVVDEEWWFKSGKLNTDLVLKQDSGTGITDLDYTPSPTQGTVTSSTGTDAIISLADNTNAGLMSPSDKETLYDNVIFRSGTEVGKPMNGTFEIADEFEVGFKQIVQDDSIENVMQFNKDEGIFYQSYLYDNLTDKNIQNRSNISVSPLSTSLQSADEITGYATNFGVQADKVIIQTTNPLSKGFVGTDLYDKQNDLNAFAQLGDLTPLENDIFDLQMNKANQDTTYTKTEVDAKVASIYKIRGSVANFASLPSSGQVSGDVWNLLDNGDNYAWVLDLNNTGVAGWDKLSGSVDLTAYETKVVAESKYLQIVNASATVLATVLTGISFLTGGAIVSTDSVLVAFGKVQKELNDIGTALGLKAPLANPTFTGSVVIPNATNNNEAVALGQVLKNQITKSGNQTLDNTYNGKVVTFTGSGTFTVNDTITEEGSFALKVETGVTVAWAITTPATWRVGGLTVGTAPRSLVGGDMVYIARKGSTNEIEIYGI